MALPRKDKPPYKDDQGRWYTRSLFFEAIREVPISDRVIEPVFTLGAERPGLINARTTFVEIGDPTGYKWAIKYLGDYAHWVRLMNAPWFVEAYHTWLSELNNKLKAEAMVRIIEIARGNSAQALGAARFLAEEGHNKVGKGRPSKEQISAELKRATKVLEVEDEDLARMGGLKVINGGKK